MTDLGLDKRRPSVTLMFMYTQIVSSWVLSGTVCMWKQSCGAGDCYFKLLPSWNTWVFFHFIGFICVQEKKWKRALFASFSFNELREEAERERFCWRFFSLLVSPILLFLIFFFYLRRKVRQKNTHTHRKKNKQNAFLLYSMFWIMLKRNGS